MLNRVILHGRIGRRPEQKQTGNGIACARFSLAVDRDHRSADGGRACDWFSVTAWRQTAEFVAKHFDRGDPIIVEGRLQARCYEAQDGSRRTAVDVVAERVYFCGGRGGAAAGAGTDLAQGGSGASGADAADAAARGFAAGGSGSDAAARGFAAGGSGADAARGFAAEAVGADAAARGFAVGGSGADAARGFAAGAAGVNAAARGFAAGGSGADAARGFAAEGSGADAAARGFAPVDDEELPF